ncbi:serine threonine- kinase pim-2-like protein [Labeo rohita]|uniref:non-specific serine/threonine protein kinase n=1 Tax=Labeo rohita TaxID=84645 RepID=A0A498MDV4_LABRO|nr:serine threonine- kinase pim-2-like protein [Labeo rohita]
MGLLRKALTRLRKFLDGSAVQEPQPHPDQDNETPVGACAADGGSGSETRREKKLWTYQSNSQDLKEVVPVAEHQPEQEILQPAVLVTSVRSSADDAAESQVHLPADDAAESPVHLRADDAAESPVRLPADDAAESPVRLPADDTAESPVRLPAGGSLESAVNSTAHNACAVDPLADEGIASAVSLVHQDVNSAVRPKAERDIACAVRLKLDRDIARVVRPKLDRDVDCAMRPKVDGGTASAGHPKQDQDIARIVRLKLDRDVDCAVRSKVDGGTASAVCPNEGKGSASKRHPKIEHPKVDKGIASRGHPKVDGDISSAGRPKADRGVASAVRPQVDAVTDSVPTEELDKDHICLRYEIGGRLGKGGFGSVRKATRYKDGLKVAVKYVPKMKDTTYITTVLHPKPLPLEIALAIIVNREPNCPHIIELLDWQDDPDCYFIVMEHSESSIDLEKFLKCSGGVISEQVAQYIMWQTIYAANFCCYRGVFHRDIKLQNVLVNPTTLEIKLIDFGCGDLMNDSGYTACYGTKPYFAPEYFDRGRYHAKPAKVYSLGVLLFAMLHGRFPTAKDLHCLGSNQSAFAVSKECISLLWACLQRRPDRRIPLEQMLYHDCRAHGLDEISPQMLRHGDQIIMEVIDCPPKRIDGGRFAD